MSAKKSKPCDSANPADVEGDSFHIIKRTDFRGVGEETVGDPDNPESTGTLTFQDGRFISIGLPVRVLSRGDDPRQYRFWRAITLAELIARREATDAHQGELKTIRRQCREAKPQERNTENAVSRILKGQPFKRESDTATATGLYRAASPVWQYQDIHEQLLLQSIQDLSRELNRPPKGWEVAERVARYPAKTGGKIIQGKTEQSDLTALGFGWLEWRTRGRPLL